MEKWLNNANLCRQTHKNNVNILMLTRYNKECANMPLTQAQLWLMGGSLVLSWTNKIDLLMVLDKLKVITHNPETL